MIIFVTLAVASVTWAIIASIKLRLRGDECQAIRYQLSVKDTIIGDYESRIGNLMRAAREQAECAAEQVERKNQELQLLTIRTHVAEEDADRMAKVVTHLVSDCEAFARNIKDEPVPTLRDEREALQLHDNAVKLRTSEQNGPTQRPADGNG